MENNGVYSTDKAVFHPDLVEAFSNHTSHLLSPKLVHLMIQNVCNQNCSFCLVEGTLIFTPQGNIPIEHIRSGQEVFGPDGQIATVGETSKRNVQEVIEVIIDGRKLYATKEHPLLTSDGWKEAGLLQYGDSTTVRVSKRGLALRKIDSLRPIKGNFTVYNFSCSPHEAYEANGFIVHNCAYRMPGYKNSIGFDITKHIPIEKLLEIIDDFETMGVKAVEITGGGEPLVYPKLKQFLARLAQTGLEVGLVTNGTLMSQEIADLLYETNFQWARVSIDAGNEETYIKIRRVPVGHWDRAWNGVHRLMTRRTDQIIGCGFVVTPENYMEVFKFCELASNYNVDNVRISMAFTNKGADLLSQIQINEVHSQIKRAKNKFENENFSIPNVFKERVNNLQLSPTQDYDYCGTKDVICVIEGEQRVFTCCTLAGDPRGLMGNIKDKRFKVLWEEKADWRDKFDVRKRCQVVCLYEQRNKNMLRLMDKPKHINFI